VTTDTSLIDVALRSWKTNIDRAGALFSPFSDIELLRESLLAWKDKKPPPDSLLNTQFYSVSAYRLGPDRFVKYSARPCRTASAASVNRSDPNFLRAEMAEARECVLRVPSQPQRLDKYMPVEDTTIEWKESDSAFVPVARIEIPGQEFVSNQDVCEDLSFNPCHALPDHRPVGALNRVRKQVYLNVVIAVA
jgi:hypothetical protein